MLLYPQYMTLERRAAVDGSTTFMFAPRKSHARLRYFGVPAGPWRISVTGSLFVDGAGSIPLDTIAEKVRPEEVDEPVSSQAVDLDALLNLMRGFPSAEEAPTFYFLHTEMQFSVDDYLLLRVEDLSGKGGAPIAIVANMLVAEERPTMTRPQVSGRRP